MAVKFTFIVATIDRDAQLKKCIASIESSHLLSKDIPIEILVVVQKSSNLKDIALKVPEITKFFYIDKIGLSCARNFAIGKSRGEYLIFLDDDAFVSDDFIDCLASVIRKHSKVNAFCGRLMDPVSKVSFSRLFYNEEEKSLSRFNYQYFMGSAHILSRKAINNVGLYDENFGVGARFFGSEETDMFFRLKAAGEKVLYVPEVVFFHPIPAASANYMGKYAHALGAVVTKNCLKDMINFPIYFFIIFERIVKSSIRLLQKKIFRGRYIEKDRQYHYASVLSGTFGGIKAFLRLK